MKSFFSETEDAVTWEDEIPTYQCPCCDYFTLLKEGGYEVCPVCYWEDSGLDINQPDLQNGTNKNISLRTARNNFTQFGACNFEMVENVLPLQEREKYIYEEREIIGQP